MLTLHRHFGDLEQNEKYDARFVMPDHKEILKVGNLRGQDGEFDSLFVQADQSPLLWHADDSFRTPQPLGSILYCVEAPHFVGTEEQKAFKEVTDKDIEKPVCRILSSDSPHRTWPPPPGFPIAAPLILRCPNQNEGNSRVSLPTTITII